MLNSPQLLTCVASASAVVLLAFSQPTTIAVTEQALTAPALAAPEAAAPVAVFTNPYLGLGEPPVLSIPCAGTFTNECFAQAYDAFYGCVDMADGNAAIQWNNAQDELQSADAAALLAFQACQDAANQAGTSDEPCYTTLAETTADNMSTFNAKIQSIFEEWESARLICLNRYIRMLYACCT